MCGNGWGLSPWGSPWGIGNGWGSAWGEIPWGGCPVEPPTTVPPIEIRPGWGQERVTRYRERRREREYVLNVLFAVEGLHAKAKSGRPRIIAGTGTSIRLRRLRHAQCGLGAATVYADSQIQAVAFAATCDCGEPEIFAGCRVELGEVSPGKGSIGSVNIRTIRNPTDEEILMMIAEIV